MKHMLSRIKAKPKSSWGVNFVGPKVKRRNLPLMTLSHSAKFPLSRPAAPNKISRMPKDSMQLNHSRVIKYNTSCGPPSKSILPRLDHDPVDLYCRNLLTTIGEELYNQILGEVVESRPCPHENWLQSGCVAKDLHNDE
uniref:Uncharacterized protein n=1 Tax=Glossina pallidipes TaxID=7398 RepID=A0A1B0A866_GLOPL